MVGGGAENSNDVDVSPSILFGKFDSNGQPDTSLSPDGFKIIGINNATWLRRLGNSIFDSSGNLLTVGFLYGIASTWDSGAIRTTSSGNIGTTFATNGYFQFDSSQAPLNEAANEEYADSVLVDSGNIYITGYRYYTDDTVILKLQESNGSIIDAMSGIPLTSIRSRASFIRGNYIYIASNTLPNQSYGWAKINKNDLTYDTGYGTGGYYKHNNNPAGRPYSIYVNPIDEAYIGGAQYSASEDGYMVKATSTGEVDTGWANNGVMVYSDLSFPGSSDRIMHILMHNTELVIVGHTEVMINSTPCKRNFLDVAPENHMPEDKDILSFNCAASENPGLSSNVIGTVNASTINVVVPYGTNISSLVPDIRIDGATVFPADGDAVNFSGGPVTYTVEAVDSTIKEYTVSVVVAAPHLVSIQVSPESGSVGEGSTLQYTAIGTYADSSTATITATVTWTSSAASVATINASGLATAVAAGTSTITATKGAITDSKTFTVTAGTYTADGVTFKMVLVPGGKTFPTGMNNEGSATVANAYWIGETEVTYELWNKVYAWATNVARGANRYYFANVGTQGDNGSRGIQHPVTTVNWLDSMVWCNALTEWYNALKGTSYVCVYRYSGAIIRDSRASNATACDGAVASSTAKGFRLLSENEWELAARYRDGTLWTYGDHASGDDSGACYNDGSILGGLGMSTVFKNYALSNTNSGSRTAAVKSKTNNALGLYDMSGNVWEWCFDLRGGPGERVFLGGGWFDSDHDLQVGYWYSNYSWLSGSGLGFRFARTQ